MPPSIGRKPTRASLPVPAGRTTGSSMRRALRTGAIPAGQSITAMPESQDRRGIGEPRRRAPETGRTDDIERWVGKRAEKASTHGLKRGEGQHPWLARSHLHPQSRPAPAPSARRPPRPRRSHSPRRLGRARGRRQPGTRNRARTRSCRAGGRNSPTAPRFPRSKLGLVKLTGFTPKFR